MGLNVWIIDCTVFCGQLKTMGEVFDGYERQYCELSANLSKKCTTASLLDGGNRKISSDFSFVLSIHAECR